jgi:hypothetical protein
MSSVAVKMQLPKMRVAYIRAFEGLLAVKPELELTQRSALDEDFMRRFFAHIEEHGIEQCDLDTVHFKITAAQLGIMNTRAGWENFLNARGSRSLL